MSEIFIQKDVEKLLYNKFVVIIGSSVQRSMYKDLVKLLRKDDYLSDSELRAKGEYKFENDDLLEGGRKDKLTNCISYKEVREYKTDFHLVRFYFVTKCYNKYMESVLSELDQDPRPDVVIINSCLWDITRYGLGSNILDTYAKHLHSLCKKFKEMLPTDSLVIWNSTLPVDKDAKGGVFVPEVENFKNQLAVKILACNQIAHQIICSYDFDYLDLNYFLKNHLHRRAEDGVHWDMTAHRRITNLIVFHIAEAWDFKNVTPTANTQSKPSATLVLNPAIVPKHASVNYLSTYQRKCLKNKTSRGRNRGRGLKNIYIQPTYEKRPNGWDDFTKDCFFDKNAEGFFQGKTFPCHSGFSNMLSQPSGYADENCDPNYKSLNECHENVALNRQPYQTPAPILQNFEWQEYHQDNLQQRSNGFSHYANNRRFQPYGNYGQTYG